MVIDRISSFSTRKPTLENGSRFKLKSFRILHNAYEFHSERVFTKLQQFFAHRVTIYPIQKIYT